MINKEDSLGIPNYGPVYLANTAGYTGEALLQEFYDISVFVNSLANTNTIPEFQGKKKRLQFINYGDYQLIYVLTIDESRQYTLVVDQPNVPRGMGKREFDNLQVLHKKNKEHVIKPLYYYADKSNLRREAYVTPYSYQSRCIGIEDKAWGMWVPEPEYLFHDFNSHDKKIINSSMVALLIKFYNQKRKQGLSNIRLDGGDFMLEKGFEEDDITTENILKKMKLIAARNLVELDLDEYINQLRKELSGQVTDKKDMKIIEKSLNCPMDIDEIDEGVSLGLTLREKQRNEEISI